MADKDDNIGIYQESDLPDEKTACLSQLNQMYEKCPNDSLLFIISNRSRFLSLLQEKDIDMISSAIVMLGKACNADSSHRKKLNKLMIKLSSDMNDVVLKLQRYLISLKKLQVLEKLHLDSLLYLTEFLKAFQLILPSSSLDSVSMLLPLIETTCDKVLKNHKELHSIIIKNLKFIKEEQKQLCEHLSLSDKKERSENEKLHLQEPPENFRSLSVLPTIDDIDLPCSFLRPNLVKGKYKDAEHYLDVQFRLLREDYIKPLRDGIAEYKSLKKDNKSFKNCKNVRVYCNVFIHSEEFVDGDLLHEIQFVDKYFSTIQWEHSKRFLTGNLLCLSTDDFHTMFFATVVKRDPKELTKGLLLIKFVEIDEKILNFDPSVTYVVIEVSTLFESYRHNLKVLQQLDENSLTMQNYIVQVEKKVNKPEYLQSATVFDMRPLLFPLEKSSLISEALFWETFLSEVDEDFLLASELNLDESERIALKSEDYKTVQVIDENKWPSASELKLDESQYIALKSAIMKEFAIIQGPPGTGKTYIGLRIVQLLLHNLHVWFSNITDSLPILIVCYTNHALDQFLEGISRLTENIVRIGGRGSNETVDRFQIKNLVRRARRNMPSFIDSRTFKAKSEIEKIKEKIEAFESNYYHPAMNNIIHENTLQDYIPQAQFMSLKKRNYPVVYKRPNTEGKIFEWLEVDTFIDFQQNAFQDKQIPSVFSNDIQGIDVMKEDEADIEFTENLRNIDYYDFDDRIVLRNISKFNKKNDQLCEQEWRYQNMKKKRTEYIRNSLQNNPTMKEKRALRIKNIWMLPINERWQLYKFWLESFLEGKKEIYKHLQDRLKTAFEELSNARTEEDLWVLEKAKVVGMTTTGAAKYRHIIEARNPVILIVEEAAEILESHIITSLTSKTKHVILIGDQQQLQPSPTVYALAVKYGMNISLFERMIMNGMDYCRLTLQHRMRPEISALIVPHIYSDLENHEVVTKFENIKGVFKNVFFVTHTFDELLVQDSKSKVNEYEARFIIRLCKYLIYQGYEPYQITVLTTYSGQLFVLKKLAVDDDVRKVRFTVVDNFQGEENDIILISFVRSNNEGDIGFLKVSNRVCVALSRAKKGLYCIGNFALLAQKSKLWKSIFQTLAANQCIGSSLRLICQNHPNVFTDVANDSDFNSVLEGGCSLKCEYRLPCGHSCTLFCHPYDSDHENVKCEKPCVKTCEKGHPCQKICFFDCKPCPVEIKKVLPRCGHTVVAPCGEDESEIKCLEKCKKSCKEGHPCPKKCFENCGSCTVVVEKLLPKCKHIAKAACWKPTIRIQCENDCNKSCPRSHLCPKKCFETCGSCEVIIERTLTCGHTQMAPCGKKENEVKCTSTCKKLLPCSHQCKNKCYKLCQRNCLQLIEIVSSVCGHSLKVECCFINNSEELAKRCSEPCKQILQCGHTCQGTCSTCKQGNEHIVCKVTCGKLLLCGHLCSNKCAELCVVNCSKIVQISSPICSHLLNIECFLSDNLNELRKKCINPCKTILPCGHTCTGSCGSCYQGCLHVSCDEICNRTLICGHKCEEKCSISCPPCKKSCENRCVHKRCPNRCGDPCVKCVKPCIWSCCHKKCTRRCNDICDRDPCNERCLKKLPCSHPCVGFCGEPCPEECFLCSENVLKENSSDITSENNLNYIYLEDCKHTFKEDDLLKWLTISSSKLHEIKLKTCPQCGSIIRRNFRFNKIIKYSIAEVEKVKHVTKYNKNNNLTIQRSLLNQMNKSHFNINNFYKSVIKVLSGGRVRDIYELTNLENIMNIAQEIELKTYSLHSMFALTPLIEKLIVYMRSCREWMIDFIGNNFLLVSEYQLHQLSEEIYRLKLLSFLLNIAKEKHFVSLSPEFEKCALRLMNFRNLNDDNMRYFEKHTKNFINLKVIKLPVKSSYPKEIVNMSALWYRCSEDHIICYPACPEISDRSDCYKCRKVTDEKLSNLSSETDFDVDYSEGLDDPDVKDGLDEKNVPFADDTIRKNERYFNKTGRNSDRLKIYSYVREYTTATLDFVSQRKPNFHSEFLRKPDRSRASGYRYSKDNTFRKNTERRGASDTWNLTGDVKKPTIKNWFHDKKTNYAFRKNAEKSTGENLSRTTRSFNKPNRKENISEISAENNSDGKISNTRSFIKPASKSSGFPRMFSPKKQ